MNEATEDIGEGKAEARRRRIVAAAADRFRREGFHGASMAEIARAAGMSVGQIYREFENKEALIAAIVEQDLEEGIAFLSEVSSGDGGLVDLLVSRAGDGVARAADPARSALMLEVAAEAARNPAVARAVQQADVAVRNRCRLMMADLRRPGEDMAELDAKAEMIGLLFEGLPLRLVKNPDLDRERFEKILQRVIRCVLEGG
ncbi:MAG: TetR/AcrR family transcriptional regulator [Kiloniellales bacterium]|nr:TetR/AcrR family transcriptional regulator [Caulobacteraceae bacterium]